MDNFLDRNLLVFEGTQAIQFIQRIYSPNKTILKWIVNVDIQQFLPSKDSPTPKLDVQYLNSQLITTLSYNYGNSNVLPQDENDVLTDPKNGKLYKRQKDMEAIYQNDLMELFIQEELPFLLENPGHIAVLR